MTTTIQLEDQTIDWLRMYKKQHNLKTYDETIKFLFKVKTKDVEEFRGILKGISRKELMKDLRDKKNRF